MLRSWQGTAGLTPRQYVCPHCGNRVATIQGYHATGKPAQIYICPFCYEPTYFGGQKQIPGTLFGDPVADLPVDVDALYAEARRSMASSAYTGAAMLCREVLMNVAVAEGASPGLSFGAYVDHLADEGFVPPKGRGWVDHIRQKGNEANHEIALVSQAEAEEIISFAGMLLKFMYELPAKKPPKGP